MFGRKHQAREKAAPLTVPSNKGLDAVRFLIEQDLEPTPTNYAMAWQVTADRNSLVALAVDAIAMEGRGLLQGDVDRIMAAEASRSRKSEQANPAQEAIRHQTLRLADLATDAAEQSSAFGRTLNADLSALGAGSADLHDLVHAMIDRANGAESKLRAASREIERLRDEVDASRDDAMRDMLTGLPNRRGADLELKALKGKRGIIALADIDHFKAINDRHGHGVGDRVLKGVASSLAESVGLHMVARWGGEEFVIVMEAVTPAQADVFLSRARGDLADRRFRLRDSDAPLGQVTISIGAASFEGTDPGAAIEAADRLLYAAKRDGRNRVATSWTGSAVDA